MKLQLRAMIYKLYKLLLKVETGVLVTLLLSMIGIAVVQIIMRNFFTSGIIWADSFIRISVLWMALVGAMVASRSGKHISIDLVSQILSIYTQTIIKRITDMFTALVCFIVMYYSYEFVKIEYEDGGLAFESVPNWLCESIIPFAFLIIGLRYFFSAVFNLRHSA
ncbi:MAG: TRAP transporter small permease subunit [Methylococcales bacterium]|nr:TRAP transporter small permease subunit [Methylococcales bacterium]MCK5478617.1 TRAP transporter small permease subunit [Methylococcales bacterium]